MSSFHGALLIATPWHSSKSGFNSDQSRDPNKHSSHPIISLCYAPFQLLMQIYIACISAVSTAMEVYSTTLDVTKAETEAIESLVQKCTEQQVDIRSTWLQNKKNVAVRIESVSKSRQKLGLGDSIPMMKSASIIVYDVPSIQSAGKHLGSVAFSEAFLESTVILVSVVLRTPTGDEEKLNGQHLVLTENSASFLSWPHASFARRYCRDYQHALPIQCPASSEVLVIPYDHDVLPLYVSLTFEKYNSPGASSLVCRSAHSEIVNPCTGGIQ
ncbi:hypothetical protein CAPTEDRAFT_187844 [Capitella teleta]|uniref:DAAF9 pita-bread-like domain-containing protein n=1 Tax=Capitella teleta TaxID=283909 RepID=R7U3F9_CAPTE|nr:hypothetical protein CAPTEDRAFT_187844 [Capitella teleta]|eukprot:ELT97710.1 hypothetical protein CAPTEDRAFT_187844 [Capitella teleta]